MVEKDGGSKRCLFIIGDHIKNRILSPLKSRLLCINLKIDVCFGYYLVIDCATFALEEHWASWTRLAVAGVLGIVPPGAFSTCCFTIWEKKVWKENRYQLQLLWAHFDSWRHLKKVRLKADQHSSQCPSVQRKYEAITIGLLVDSLTCLNKHTYENNRYSGAKHIPLSSQRPSHLIVLIGALFIVTRQTQYYV